MNLEDLRAAQVDERGADSLQPLPPTFYEQAADYLADIRERRDRAAEEAGNPFDSEDVRRLTDELETATEVVEALYERRMGKLVKRASLAAAGMPADPGGLTREEAALFDDLVERLEANRAAVLESLDAGARRSRPRDDAMAEADVGSTPSPSTSATGEVDPTGPEPTASTPADPAVEPADPEPEPDGGVTGSTEPGDGSSGPDRVTVRITTDVGEIYGVDDRVYTLNDEDVVTLPDVNAAPLLERGAATRVE